MTELTTSIELDDVRLDPLPLAEYCPLWLSPTRLPRLTVLFLVAHGPQNASYKVRYQLPYYALTLHTILSMWDVTTELIFEA